MTVTASDTYTTFAPILWGGIELSYAFGDRRHEDQLKWLPEIVSVNRAVRFAATYPGRPRGIRFGFSASLALPPRRGRTGQDAMAAKLIAIRRRTSREVRGREHRDLQLRVGD